MDSQEQHSEPQISPEFQKTQVDVAAETATPAIQEPAETRFLKALIFGPNGTRVGWSVTLFLLLTFLIMAILGAIAFLIQEKVFHVKPGTFDAGTSIVQELVQFLGLLTAAAVCAGLERRRVLDYNLRDARSLRHFSTGFAGGFAALSTLVAALYLGGWLHFGARSLSGIAIAKYAVLWGVAFLFTGLGEEGMTRCYMLFTLARGVNYWWALGTVSVFSFFAWLNSHGSGAGGIYLMAALGVVPCLYLHLKKAPSAGFWEAAWLTSTFFGYIHTFNPGETWIGIFATTAIGFVFCVSIRLTGSAWWAIGFHAAWDWAQTFFYGTPDSGLQPNGHLLTSNPAGSVLWSGGSAGPEGSVLILPIVLLTMLALIVVYRRRPEIESSSPADQPQLS